MGPAVRAVERNPLLVVMMSPEALQVLHSRPAAESGVPPEVLVGLLRSRPGSRAVFGRPC